MIKVIRLTHIHVCLVHALGTNVGIILGLWDQTCPHACVFHVWVKRQHSHVTGWATLSSLKLEHTIFNLDDTEVVICIYNMYCTISTNESRWPWRSFKYYTIISFIWGEHRKLSTRERSFPQEVYPEGEQTRECWLLDVHLMWRQ